ATLSHEARQLSQAITNLEETRAALEQERTLATTEWEQAAALRTQQEVALAEVEEKKRRLWQEELAEAKQLVRRLREDGREIVAGLRERLQETPAALPRARHELAQFLYEQEEAIAAKENELQPAPVDGAAPPQIGDEVEAQNGKIRGELVAVHGNRARIRRGGLTFDVASAQLRKVSGKREHKVHVAVESNETVIPEINLLGLRVSEALPRLEEFLDRAVLSQHSSVRIVHGMGTGALRRAVREFLADSPYCASYSEATRAEGGNGVTIVELSS
ncbi:MAG: Smr/MutS family protein, partial [Candidatus Binatia bacterium]